MINKFMLEHVYLVILKTHSRFSVYTYITVEHIEHPIQIEVYSKPVLK